MVFVSLKLLTDSYERMFTGVYLVMLSTELPSISVVGNVDKVLSVSVSLSGLQAFHGHHLKDEGHVVQVGNTPDFHIRI